MQQWPTVCNRLLNGKDREIRLWNDLIKIELRARAKVRQSLRSSIKSMFSLLASTSRSFQSISSKCYAKDRTMSSSIPKCSNEKHQVGFFLVIRSECVFFRTSYEFNVLDYIWSDIDNQIPSNYVWTPSTSRIPVGDAKFSLKAVAISTDLQKYVY